MKWRNLVVVFALCTTLAGVFVSRAVASEIQHSKVEEYAGQLTSVHIDHCGMKPGTCEGNIVLREQGGKEVTLAIKPGTWLQRGGEFVTIGDLAIGNYIRAKATRIPGSLENIPQVTIAEANVP